MLHRTYDGTVVLATVEAYRAIFQGPKRASVLLFLTAMQFTAHILYQRW